MKATSVPAAAAAILALVPAARAQASKVKSPVTGKTRKPEPKS